MTRTSGSFFLTACLALIVLSYSTNKNNLWVSGEPLSPPGTIRAPLFTSTRCIDADTSQGSRVGGRVHLWECRGRAPTNFYFERVGTSYRIRTETNRRCLGVDGGKTGNVVRVTQQACEDLPHQMWKLTLDGNVAYDPFSPNNSNPQPLLQIRAMHTGFCISVGGGKDQNGAAIITFPCKASGNNNDQLWDVAAGLQSVSGVSYVPGTTSMWKGPYAMPLVAASAANLPDGRILAWASYVKTDFGNGREGKTVTAIFDPDTTTSTEMTIEDTGHDMFCPGTSVLPDGRILITGGANDEKTTFYDPRTNVWSIGPQLNIGRGYQGQTVLPDGSVFLLGGSFTGDLGGKSGEVWNATTNVWTLKSNIKAEGSIVTNDSRGIYRQDNHIWLFTAPNGLIFHAGPAVMTHWIDVTGEGTVTPVIPRGTSDRMNGNAVMYDIGKVLVLGGAYDYTNAPATTEAYVIDINDETNVTVTPTGSLNFARVLSNSVILPNGEVLCIGGQHHAVIFHDELAQYRTEIWNPTTGNWTILENMHTPRTYHSVALLLKDGRVWSAGGGLCGPCRANHLDAEIFIPPYLIDSSTGLLKPQPAILQNPSILFAGDVFNVTMDTAQVHTFSLNRLGAVTHAVDNDTRRIPLTVLRQDGATFTLTLPANPNVSLAGTYFLFAMNEDGVPSVASTVTIRLAPPATAAPTGAPVTAAPTGAPVTAAPTGAPFPGMSPNPTFAPLAPPTTGPTATPASSPTGVPTRSPTAVPTLSPTASPTAVPTLSPTSSPTAVPTRSPSSAPTQVPTRSPSSAPTESPFVGSTEAPTSSTTTPTSAPSTSPTWTPTSAPTWTPTSAPTVPPTMVPSSVPTAPPTAAPSSVPTVKSTTAPSSVPTNGPTTVPSSVPTTAVPSSMPSLRPVLPVGMTASPTRWRGSDNPTFDPTALPSALPTALPSAMPTPPLLPLEVEIGSGPIVSMYSNRCLDQDTRASSRGNVHQWACHFRNNQQFRVMRRGDVYRFILKHSNQCLSVTNGRTHNGANVVQEPCIEGAAHQEWTVTGSDNARFLQANHSGKCLSLAGSTAKKFNNGANAVQWECTISTERKWHITAFDN